MTDIHKQLDLTIVNGFHVRRDDVHFLRLGDALGDYQQKVRDAAYRHVTTWQVAIDVGGHIGIFSRDFASRFRTVHAFEPMPYNRRCLELNAAPNLVIHPCGLGDRAGTAEMRYNWKNSGGSEVIDPGNVHQADRVAQPSGGGHIVAEIRTLDSFELHDVGLIKIDVQGMEEHVLRGAAQTFVHSRPVVILEEKVVKTRPNDRRAIEAAATVMHSYGYHRAEMVGQDAIYVPNNGTA